MIRRVRLQNYKAVRDVSFTPSRLTVIVGPNAGGKTSILEAINCVAGIAKTPARNVLQERLAPSAIRRIGAKGPTVIGVETDLRKVEVTIECEQPNIQGTASPSSESVRIQAWQRTSIDSDFQEPPIELSSSEQNPVSYFGELYSTTFVRLDPAALSEAVPDSARVPFLAFSGRGLANVLAYLFLLERDRFRAIESALREVVPAVAAISFEKSDSLDQGEVQATGRLDLFGSVYKELFAGGWKPALIIDTTSAKGLPASRASEGTLLALGIITHVIVQRGLSIILLDDLDRALHPIAQRNLIGIVRSQMKENTGLQVIATSHSPLLLDTLRADEVVLTSVNEKGVVSAGALSDHKDFRRWKDEMAPGEFWSMVGEKWLSQAPAATVNE